ncbi:metallophosphoesterase [Helicobacter trogontum]|uniref:Calcineurin-like phosphoesterase domain-containing protein n=1 Tax=Helicobacter trogontum TaxID=50960 RepID=A0A4U8SCD4_9HELI|nr:metallophosphoesterase [Helicobacter trogontum]TLD83770.1 hypothetical protein LS81_003240 [Helicobacter trogontum]
MTIINDFTIKKDAFFVADSHFKENDEKLLEYFDNFPSGRQIILMGDIFHFLIGSIHTSYIINEALIRKLAGLTRSNEIIILEGNHDFGLDSIMWEKYSDYNTKNLKIYTYCMQPIIIRDDSDNICILSHGDLWINKNYDSYRKFITKPYILSAFWLLDKLSYGIIYRALATRINQKLIAEFSFFRTDFLHFMSERIAKYKSHVIQKLIDNGFATDNTKFCIIEGHYHLGKHVKKENIFYNALQSCYFHKDYLSFKKGDLFIEVTYGTKKSISNKNILQ